MNTEEVVQQALQKAIAEGHKILEKEQERLRTDRKTIIAGWKQAQKARRESEHGARVKSGQELAEAFVQEVAGAYLRLTGTKENLKILDTLRITFYPGKSDQAGNSSVGISDGSKRVMTFFKASMQLLQEKETRLLSRLQEQTGFSGSTPIEMMKEIAQLQNQMELNSKSVSELSPIATAAQQVLLARADGLGLADALENLEQTFLPPGKRKKPETPETSSAIEN